MTLIPRAKILIVDDLKYNLLALEGLLRRDDVEIFEAESGTRALELMIAHEFAVALVDVQMPGMSGFELAEFMRGARRTKTVPIIFVTATAKDQSYSFKGYESGAVDFLHKPLDPFAVKSKVNVFVELFQQKRELKFAEAKFRGLLETAPDAIVITNGQGRIELINRQAEVVFGYERADLLEQNLEILLPERFRAGHVAHRLKFAANPSARQMGKILDLVGRRKDGTEFSIDVSLSPLQTESGILISAAIRDISERRAAEQEQERLLTELRKIKSELEQAVQIREDFMSIASHELKTPLTSLKLQSQMRKRNLEKGNTAAFSAEKLAKMFNGDERQIERITLLIDDMLDISRISSGKLSMSMERFDLCELVGDVVERSTEQFAAAGCPIKVDLPAPSFGNGDRFRIEQVVTNLLTNAMRYGAGKPISIRVNGSKDGTEIIVRDQGRGIAEVNHERIFQRFERAVSSDDISGLGLGLYIVKQILKAHHGSIHVESELGKGAAFIVQLPL